MLLERLDAWDLKVEWEHLFQTILKWFRRKNNLRGLRRTPKGKQRNIYIYLAKPKNTVELWIISALVASNWSQITFFTLAKVLTSILAQFSPSKHSSATRRHLAIVETRLKSWKRRTAENYSRSIVMLLTWNRLHFSWSYWLPKILLLPYTCDGIKIHKKLYRELKIFVNIIYIRKNYLYLSCNL